MPFKILFFYFTHLLPKNILDVNGAVLCALFVGRGEKKPPYISDTISNAIISYKRGLTWKETTLKYVLMRAFVNNFISKHHIKRCLNVTIQIYFYSIHSICSLLSQTRACNPCCAYYTETHKIRQ